MTISEANKIKEQFYSIDQPSEEDIFLFTEAMDFLISETHDPTSMMELGGWYYGEKDYDLALKYYEMAAAYDSTDAYECLGYIWYYGRTGQKDYEKAFKNFSRAAERGDLIAEYKVADMYKDSRRFLYQGSHRWKTPDHNLQRSVCLYV